MILAFESLNSDLKRKSYERNKLAHPGYTGGIHGRVSGACMRKKTLMDTRVRHTPVYQTVFRGGRLRRTHGLNTRPCMIAVHHAKRFLMDVFNFLSQILSIFKLPNMVLVILTCFKPSNRVISQHTTYIHIHSCITHTYIYTTIYLLTTISQLQILCLNTSNLTSITPKLSQTTLTPI